MRKNVALLNFMLILFGIYFMAGMTADRLGYLMTGRSFFIRMYIIFPVLVFFWYLWIFIYKWHGGWGGITIYEMNLRRFRGWKGRLQLFLTYLFGFPALLAVCAWLAIGSPAWLAFMTASEPFRREYIYTPNDYVAQGYNFKDSLTGDRASVRVTTELYASFPDEVSNFYAEKVVCLHGRTSMFGTIVSKVKIGRC